MSRSSLWADLDCEDADKTLVYLERSKSFPINLSLRRGRDDGLTPHDPFFQITPQDIGRLKSLFVEGTLLNLEDITTPLSCPAPLLEDMSIIGARGSWPDDTPGLTPTLFGGNLSLLHTLRLEFVCTESPWRNMDNLTSLRLFNTEPPSMSQLLDFFESAPHLRKVELRFGDPIPGAEDGRLVSVAHLRDMYLGGGPSSALLDHLLIPVGARLEVQVDLPKPPFPIEDHTFLDNLGNLRDFTTIQSIGGWHLEFCGPNGGVLMILDTKEYGVALALGTLAQFDTSKTERLAIDFSGIPSHPSPYHILLPMKDLRTLELQQCATPDIFVRALDPSKSPSGVVVCPKLEKLDIRFTLSFDIKNAIGMAAARKSLGATLNFVRITNPWEEIFAHSDVLELEKHVSHLEWIDDWR